MPGELNTIADRISRIQADMSQSKLNPLLFREAVERWGTFTLDAFASKLNTQTVRYVSYRTDPSYGLPVAADTDRREGVGIPAVLTQRSPPRESAGGESKRSASTAALADTAVFFFFFIRTINRQELAPEYSRVRVRTSRS